MNLNEWYQRGLSSDEYIHSMKQNKEEMLTIYEKFNLTAEDQGKLGTLKEQQLRVIALSEDWCGDALLNNPVLMKIAEAAGMELRFVLRDQNLELMDQYLTNGTSRAIPIYIFINKEGEVVAVWGPRAAEMQAIVMERRSGLPDKDAPDFQEKQMAMYKQLRDSYLTDAGIWQTVADSIISKLL
ncbi:thioredoxin-like protein [Neobacillus bataviensis]|uniref:Thioredoxin-like protein n=1 Tax=Neobacillus bataviensis TaxID=220685 RepID=A0A561CWS1_9BACI|nr:thioredoxin family protein [Neobacillus bataviensis]TWD95683.1 thioredoxin-like protein [Neobacillus bataviensis]